MSEGSLKRAPRYANVFMYEDRDGAWKARITGSNGVEKVVMLASFVVSEPPTLEQERHMLVRACLNLPGPVTSVLLPKGNT